MEHVRNLLQTRESLLDHLSAAYADASSQGVTVEGGFRDWEDKWDGSASLALQGTGEEPDEDGGEWSEDE